MATLDDAAFGAATKVTPKFVSPSDPAAQWTGAMRGPAFFAYSNNYLIDVKVGIIMDVEASRAIRQAEVGASKTMIERSEEHTSELQSQSNLVCRLLLEKKKTTHSIRQNRQPPIHFLLRRTPAGTEIVL